MQRSSRDPASLRSGLETWLASKLPTRPRVGEIGGTSATGMSSETLIFDASWTEDGTDRSEDLVARLAPSTTDAPVFPAYDLDRQYRAIELVGELTDVPVPKTWGVEPGGDVLGTPFFVMGKIEGEPPPDVMPYTFGDNWLFDASREEQRRLQDASVEILVSLHAIERAEERFSFLAFQTPGHTALRRHVAHTRGWYDWATEDGLVSPLIERAFDWLDRNWPQEELETVLSWGDARIGNVLYRDFEPVAVLDWEMAGLGPRELDIAWMVYAHEVFEHLARGFGTGGMPHFMREEDVVSTYTEVSGRPLADLHFFRVYASVQWAIVFLRTGFRGVHFGEREMPADPEELIYHAAHLEALLA